MLKEQKVKNNFASTTFKEICRCFNNTLFEYDIEMKELIQDFEVFCSETGLLDNANTKIRVVLAGTTFVQNMENKIYYAPSDRGYQSYTYLGLYKDKAVRAIGKVTCSTDIDFDFDSGLITSNSKQPEISEEQQAIVK